jgi:carboxymethylenebutenolidase
MATRIAQGLARLGRDVRLAPSRPSQSAAGEDADSGAGYLVTPPSGRGPGVVVIQEWWGLVDHIRDVCDRLAREGFVALAPDLYRGDSTGDPSQAERLMMELDLPRAAGDLEAAVATLLNQDATSGSQVGCIGFCMGGQLALYAATRSERIGAVVDCYGIHPNVELELSNMKAAVLGVFAENDGFVTPDAARMLEAELHAAGVPADFKIHAGVGHAFMNDSRPDAHDAVAARAAWNDILAFLRAELA